MKINFNKYIDDFKSKVLPIDYYRRGMFLSEGFAICSLCSYLEIDILIESGVANGRSSEIFAKYGIPKIYSIELAKGEKELAIFNQTKDRLKKYSNIELQRGNSLKLIPKILSDNKDKNIALIVDGPKGKTACKFTLEMTQTYSNISFVALHDQDKRFFNYIMSDYFKDVFYTNNKKFNKYYFLDEKDKEYIEKATQEKDIDPPCLGIKVLKEHK